MLRRVKILSFESILYDTIRGAYESDVIAEAGPLTSPGYWNDL